MTIDVPKLSNEEALALWNQMNGGQASAKPVSSTYVQPDPEDRKHADAGVMARIGRGFMDIGQGTTELYKHVTGSEDADQYTRDLKDELARYERGRGDQADTFDPARVVGQTAALLPFTEGAGLVAGASKLPGILRAGARFLSMGAAQGAAAGLAVPPPDKSPAENYVSDKTTQGVVGAVTGLVVPPIVKAVAGGLAPYTTIPLARLANTVWEHMKLGALVTAEGEMTSAGRALIQKLGYDPDNVPEEVKKSLSTQVNKSVDPSLDGLPPEQRVRAERMKRVTGEDATTGQITRNFEDQQTENSLAKNSSVGAPLRTRFDSQNAGLINAGDNLTEAAGGTAKDPYEVGKLASEFVKGTDKAASDAVSEVYKLANQRAQELDLGMSPDKLLEKLENLKYQYGADTVLPKVKMWLKDQGLMDADGNLVRVGPNSTRGIEVTKIEELRKMLGGMYGEGLDARNHNRVVRSLIRSLDQDVMDWAGEDVYKGARAAAKARFDDLEIPGIKDLINGDVAPEDFVDKFVRRGKIDDLQAFRDYSFKSKDPMARNLWDSTKAEALRQIFGGAVRRSSVDSLGNPEFTAVALENSLAKWGKNGIADRRFDILFTPQEKATLNEILQVAKDRIPTRGTVNHSNSSADFWNTLDRVIASAPIPGVARMAFRGALRAAKGGVQDVKNEEAVSKAMTPPNVARKAEQVSRTQGILTPPITTFLNLVPSELRRKKMEERKY